MIQVLNRKCLPLLLLAVGLLLVASPILTGDAHGLNTSNAVANPGFESSNGWFETATFGNGTVNLQDGARASSGSFSARLTAVNKTACGISECKDTVRATVEQYVQLNNPP